MVKSKIEILLKPAEKDLRDINLLIPQTAQKPHLLSMLELKQLISQERHCRLVVARRKIGIEMRIVGMAAVTFAYVPTGSVAVIEDVIVDDAFRGLGLGKKIIKKLIDIAKSQKAKHIGLRANPRAQIANNMYKGLGFFQSDVVYYRMNLFLPKPSSVKKVEKVKRIQMARKNSIK